MRHYHDVNVSALFCHLTLGEHIHQDQVTSILLLWSTGTVKEGQIPHHQTTVR